MASGVELGPEDETATVGSRIEAVEFYMRALRAGRLLHSERAARIVRTTVSELHYLYIIDVDHERFKMRHLGLDIRHSYSFANLPDYSVLAALVKCERGHFSSQQPCVVM